MSHHFVPQRYLSRFQNEAEPGYIWLHVRAGQLRVSFLSRFGLLPRRATSARETVEQPGRSAIEQLIRGENISA